MAQWWEGLSVLQHVFLYTAAPFTVVLLIQAVLAFIGLGGGSDMDADGSMDADADFDADSDMDADTDAGADQQSGSKTPGFRFFSIQGIVAFFCIFGWTGYALSQTALPDVPVILIATAAGFAAMLLLGLMFHAVRRLQASGNLRYSNAVGSEAEVYIPIPPQRTGRGKVMVMVQQRLIEAEALTDEPQKLRTGEVVRVVGNIGNTLIVKNRGE